MGSLLSFLGAETETDPATDSAFDAATRIPAATASRMTWSDLPASSAGTSTRDWPRSWLSKCPVRQAAS